MRDSHDKRTLQICDLPNPRGRPSTGQALTNAERQRRYRNKTGVKSLTIQISVDLSDRLDEYVKFRNTTKAAVVEKLITSQLFRKR